MIDKAYAPGDRVRVINPSCGRNRPEGMDDYYGHVLDFRFPDDNGRIWVHMEGRGNNKFADAAVIGWDYTFDIADIEHID